MDTLEERVAQLEADLQRLSRQNQRMRAASVALLLLVGLPLLAAWKGTGNVTFETVTAERFNVVRDGQTVASLGSAQNVSPRNLRGVLRLNAEGAGVIAELGGLDSGPNGILKLAGVKKPRSRSQIELGVNPFGTPQLAMYSEPQSTTASLAMSVNSQGNGSILLSNPPGRTVFSLGSSSKGDPALRLLDQDGKANAVLEIAPKTLTPGLDRGATSGGLKSARALPGVQGGGGRLTLSDRDGQSSFKAP